MAEAPNSYPFPSSLHVASSVTLKLNENNYLLWKTQFEALLCSQKLLGFVNGQNTTPAATVTNTIDGVAILTPNPLFEAWNCTDQLIKSWIFGTLTEEVLGYVHSLATSQEVWQSLADNFNKSSVAREFDLRRRLQLLTAKGKDFLVYCREFRVICDQLSSIGKPIEESMKIFTFLNGLTREYDPISTVVQSSMSRFPPPTFSDVVSEISGFHTRLQSYESPADISPFTAFQTQRSGYIPSGQRGRNISSSRFGSRGRGGFSTRGRGFSQQVNSSGWNRSQISDNTRPICQICGRTGHIALKCWNRFDHAYQSDDVPKALAALHVSDDVGKEWYPDSGATAHITASTSSLQNPTPYHGPESVLVGNGNQLPITHVGSTVITSSQGSIPLLDVLVCPQIQKSLLSISKLCDDYPCGVFFDANWVYVIDLQTQKVVTKGPRHENLYVLKNPEFVAFYSNRQVIASDMVWHQRLGHANFQILQHLKNSKEIVFNKTTTSSVCEPCQMGKSSKLPFFPSLSNTIAPLDRIHCDLWGPSPIVSNQGFKYYAIFVDDYSRYSWLFPLKAKSDFYQVFVAFQNQVENQHNRKIKMFQSDGGGEFMSHVFRRHLSAHGIHHQISCPSTPQQNGLAERKHRHLTELALSMLFQSKTPFKYWVEAFYTANFVSNLLPSAPLKYKSPFELLTKQKPDYSFLRVFGTACYPCLRSYTSHKFDPRSLQCVFLGYNAQYKGYRCLYPPTGRIYISRHVIFDEEQFPFAARYHNFVESYSTPLLKAWQSAPFHHLPTVPIAPLLNVDDYEGQLDVASATPVSPPPHESVLDSAAPASSPLHESELGSGNSHESSDPCIIHAPEISSTSSQPVRTHQMTTRLQRGTRKPNPRYALLTKIDLPTVPKTVASALKHSGWTQAMGNEMDAQHQNGTMTLVPRQPGMNVLGCRWIFTVKQKADGSLDKLKARLVAKGFAQEEGVDFIETYSPVVRTSTIRVVLSIAVAKEWSITQLDVNNAFLHGDLQDEVFMEQPPGFVDPDYPNHVCKLNKALYGLKQAPRAWFNKFTNFLIEFGFSCSTADPSLFIFHRGHQTLVLLLYVDDVLLTGNSPDLITTLLHELGNKFSMKNLGNLHYFLGIQALVTDSGLFLNQTTYAEEILFESGMASANPMPTPLPTRLDAAYHDKELFSEPTYFRSIAGKLQYLTLTRPDIQFAVNFVCQRMHSPTMTDFSFLKRILRYIRGTTSYGLHLVKDSSLSIISYSDSDWGGCQDTRRSTTGFSIFLGSNLVSWCAKRQPTVSRSSTEAEYRALAHTASELTWINFLLRDLHITQPAPALLQCDNLSAVRLSANPGFHRRSKHIEIDYHYIRERVALGVIEIRHIPAVLQVADIFTKSLPRHSFTVLRAKLGVGPLLTTSLRGTESKVDSVMETHDSIRKVPTASQMMKSDLVLHNKFETLTVGD